MAKRKKRFVTRHPEEFEQLDEQLARALENLAVRNRETEEALGISDSASTESGTTDAPSQEATRCPDQEDGAQ